MILLTAMDTTPPAVPVPVPTDTTPPAAPITSSTRKRRDPFLEFTRAKAQSTVEETEALVGMTGRASDAEKEEALRAKVVKNCKDCFTLYLSCCSNEFADWESMINKSPSKLYLEESPDWTADEREQFMFWCQTKNYLKVGKYFDLMGWRLTNAE